MQQGLALLHSPVYNKGSAFSADEREAFSLHGLLPPNVQTLEEQVERAYQQFSSRGDALAKNTFMTSMKCVISFRSSFQAGHTIFSLNREEMPRVLLE